MLIHTVPGLGHLLRLEGKKRLAFALLHWHLSVPCPWPLLWTISTWFANVCHGQPSSAIGRAAYHIVPACWRSASVCNLPSSLFLGTGGLWCAESVFQPEHRKKSSAESSQPTVYLGAPNLGFSVNVRIFPFSSLGTYCTAKIFVFSFISSVWFKINSLQYTGAKDSLLIPSINNTCA